MKGRIGLLLAFHIALLAPVVVLQAVGFALFVDRFGVAGLPGVYLAVGIVMVLVVAAFSRSTEQVGLGRRAAGTLAVVALGSVALWALVGPAASPWAVALLPVWFHGSFTAANLILWRLLRQEVGDGARRAALAGVGNGAALIVGGVGAAALAGSVGPTGLLLLVPVLLAAAGATFASASKASGGAAPASPSEPRGSRSEAPALPSRTTYLALVLGGSGLALVALLLVDFGFYAHAIPAHMIAANVVAAPAAAGRPGAELTAFVGSVLGVAGAVAVLASLALRRWSLRPTRLRTLLLALPIALAAFAGLLVGGATLGVSAAVVSWSAVVAKVLSVAVAASLAPAVGHALLAALAETERERARTLWRSVVRPVAFAAVGAMLLALVALGGGGVVPVASLVLVVAVATVAVAAGVARTYPTVLARTFTRRRWGEDGTASIEGTGIELLRRSLASPHAGAVIYALERLAEHGVAVTTSELLGLLAHGAPEVRGAALERLEERGPPAAAEALEARLTIERVSSLRAATLRALAASGAAHSSLRLTDALGDADPVVRAGAIVGLARHGGSAGLAAASEALDRMVASSDRADRTSAALVLGARAVDEVYERLRVLLDDPVADVRRAAVQAAALVRHPLLWPDVIRAGDAAGMARPVERALVGGGDAALDAIETALADPDLPVAMVVMLVRTCGRMRGERAARVLEGCLAAPRAVVRWNVLQALAACGYRSRDPEAVRSELQSYGSRMRWLDETLGTLVSAPPAPLLCAALEDVWRREQDMMLLSLAQIADAPAMLALRAEIAKGDAEGSVQALAVIDAQLPPDLRATVLPWLASSPNASSAAERTISGTRPFLAARLEALICGPEATWFGPWTSACALHAVGSLGLPAAPAVLEAAEDASEALINGTARWARRTLAGEGTQRGGDMLSTLERVLILKTVQIFARTPDAVLADIADVLDEVDVAPGEAIIRKGDLGDDMYIVVDGTVGVHDGERRLDTLGEREAFGEMALLDPEPRVASVTAIDATRLLRLPQAPFHELLHDRPEIAIGIMRVLAQRLRDRIKDLAAAGTVSAARGETRS